MKPATRIGVVVFGLVAFFHLLRLALGWEAEVGGWAVPMWVSGIGLIVPAALAFLIWREHRG